MISVILTTPVHNLKLNENKNLHTTIIDRPIQIDILTQQHYGRNSMIILLNQ